MLFNMYLETRVFADFVDFLPGMVKDLEECAYLSFDEEFTGLASERNIWPFDTSEEYYLKQLNVTKGFVMFQLGITFFKVKKDPESEEEKVTCKSYNIYVYPQSKNAIFTCQGSCLSFLAEHGFDFNKLFTKGISYCNAEEEEVVRREVEEKQKERLEQLKQRASNEETDVSLKQFIPVPETEQPLLEKAREKLQSIVDGNLAETSFEKTSPFQRKLIYELIERDFNNKVSTSVKAIENNQKALIVSAKRSEEEDMKIEMRRQKEDEAYIAEVVGLRLLMKEISASKKLIVGHNCLLDLMYIINQCFSSLPDNYNDFKSLVHGIFPNIIDTKFIGSSDKFKDMFSSTILNQLHQRLTESPFKKVEVEFEDPYHIYSVDYPKEHEAGYDSFLTGLCLMSVMKYLKIDLSDKFEANKCKELNPFLNRIALFRIVNPYIFITGKEPALSRAHVFFVKFPTTWRTSDLQELFKNYGPVNIAWHSNASAFISLYNKENASCVLKTISRPPNFEIQSFADYQAEDKVKRDASRKRKKEESESSEGGSQTNGTTDNKEKKGKGKKKTKKAFAEGEIW